MPTIHASHALSRLGLIGLATLCIALPAQAQWKWKDAAGKIQYSDLPPPNGTPDKDVLQRPPGQKMPAVIVLPFGAATSTPASAPPAAASGPNKAEAEQQAKQKAQEQEQLAKQKEDERRVAQQRKENCMRAQENMKMLQDGIRLTRPNERGENVVIDDRQRAEEIQRTRGIVTSECR